MSLFAELDTTTYACLAAAALVIGWVLLRTYRRIWRHKKDRSPIARTPRTHTESPGHRLDVPDDVLRWQVQMHETARELSAQLDSRMGAIQALIAEADRAAGRLETALAGPSRAAERSQPPDPPPADQADALKSPGRTSACPTSEETADNHAQRQPSGRRDRDEIYTLADYGYEATEIAARTGCPIGEIELILGLRGKE